jgi:FKBP-type peptidyl-prolyl cis-trans isomerase
MERNAWIAVGVSVVVVGFFLFGSSVIDIFSQTPTNQAVPTTTGMDEQTPEINLETSRVQQNTQNAPTEGVPITSLQVRDDVIGTGVEAVAGKVITVHYVGTLANGQKFDSSVDRGQPFEFTLGAGQVIAGWDQGFAGMKVGGKRTLAIPASMGYGAQQVGPIPPNSTLLFEVELLGVK